MCIDQDTKYESQRSNPPKSSTQNHNVDENPEDRKQNEKLNVYFEFHGVTSNFNESLINLHTHTHTHAHT